MGTPAHDLARLDQLRKSAESRLRDATADLTQSQLDGAKDKTQFFEKLAIGSGATIAALVSFLGTHSAGLHPHWTLRCSLIALAVVLVTALYRAFRYPYYALAARNRIWIEAIREQQKCNNDYIQADPDVINLQGGGLIDQQRAQAAFEDSDVKLIETIRRKTTHEQRIYEHVQWSERVCLASVTAAMIALVWLALCNF
jgi:hypothetical protein